MEKPKSEIQSPSLPKKCIGLLEYFAINKTVKKGQMIYFDQLSDLQSLLQSRFPKAKHIIIPELTKGALMSALVGAVLVNDFSEPIVIDLVDILFSGDLDPAEIFNQDESIAGILPYFISDNPKYSYLELDDNSNVLRTREKEVISKYASAGVYFFKNLQTLLQSATFSIDNFHEVSFNDLLFLCPSFNGIIENKNTVKAVPVAVSNEISLLFD